MTTDKSIIKAALFEGDALWDDSWKESAGEATLKARMVTKDPDVLLYSSWFCPFAQRAWIAAEETGANYQWIEINPYQVDTEAAGGYTKKALPLQEKDRLHPGFVQASPRGLVPAVRSVAEDRVVWDSLPVVEYMDAVYGDGSLMPTDPHERAMVQVWSVHCTERIQKAYYRALMEQDPVREKQLLETFFHECRELANAMSDDGPFFLGQRFGLVDVALAPFWQRMIWVGGHYMGLCFPDNDPAFERMQQWWEATVARPSVANTLVCKDRLIASYTDYSKNDATSDFAKTLMK